MSRIISFITTGLGALATLAGASCADPAPSGPPERPAAPDEVLVAFSPALTPDAREQVLAEHGAIGYRDSAHAALALAAPGDAEALATALATDPRVREASLNRVTRGASPCTSGGGCGSAGRPLVGGAWTEGFQPPESALYELQWTHHRQYTWLAWAGGEQLGAGVKVAVLDTGVTPVSTLHHVAMDEGGNTIDPSGTPYDDNGHGTHMASIIASSGALWGVAPEAVIVPIKVLDADKIGTEAALIEGLWLAADVPDLKVVSMSLTFPPGYRPSLLLTEAIDAVDAAGITMVAAAGNDGLDSVGYPARMPQVIAVGATRMSRDEAGVITPVVAEYSNHSYALDLVAYGGDLSRDEDLDGVPDGVLGESMPTAESPSGLFLTVGTSPAAAYVAGAAALLAGAGVPHGELRARLQATAARLSPKEFDSGWGEGQIHVGAAMPGATPWFHTPGAQPRLLANPQLVFEEIGGELRAVAVVEVLDEDDQPAVDYQVAVHFGGDLLESAIGFTDEQGVVVLRSSPLPADAEGVVTLDVEAVMDHWDWRPVRPTPASRVDRLSYELLSSLGTGLISSAIILRYADNAWEGSPYVDSAHLAPSYSLRPMGRGASGAVVVGMRPKYYYGHDVASHTLLFETAGTGLISSAIIVDEALFNPARRAEHGTEDLLIEHVGPADDARTAIHRGGIYRGDRAALDAFFVGDDPAILVTTRGTGLISSAIIWNRALLDPSLFIGASLESWNKQSSGLPGTATSMFMLSWGERGVQDCGGSWQDVEALYPDSRASADTMLANDVLPSHFTPTSGERYTYSAPPRDSPARQGSPVGCDGPDGSGVANECGGCGPVPMGGCDAPVVVIPSCVGVGCADPAMTINGGGGEPRPSDEGCGAAGGGGRSAAGAALLLALGVLLWRRRERHAA